jgi:hypothetical protein
VRCPKCACTLAQQRFDRLALVEPGAATRVAHVHDDAGGLFTGGPAEVTLCP